MKFFTKQRKSAAKGFGAARITAYAAMLALVPAVFACTQGEPDDLPGQAAGKEIRLVTEVASRVSVDSELTSRFEQFDEIGVFAVIRSAASTQAYPSVTAEENFLNNVKFTRQADGSWLPDGDVRYFFPEDAVLDFYAYYPYIAGASPDNIIYDAGVSTYDLMTARTLAQDESDETVVLSFVHKLAMVHVEVAGQDAASSMSVKMNNVAFHGRLNLTAANQAAEFTTTTGGNNVQLVNRLGTFLAYVPAQTIAAEVELFRLNDGGEDMFYVTPAQTKLSAGAVKKYSIKPVGATMEPLKLPNTYMIQPGGHITFPVAKAYAVWESHELLKTVWNTYKTGVPTVELVWQDVNGMIPAGGLSIDGTDGDATISVRTDRSKGAGNAVVALKLDGTTVWSWHIWVSDYEPNRPETQEVLAGVMSMNRNLGATDLGFGKVEAFGLHYQWGRKDPMPNPNTLPDTPPATDVPSEVADRTLWKLDGTEVTLTLGDVADDPTDNLLNAINNPLTFIRTRSYSSYDWYSPERNHANDRWNTADGEKTVFDPCPNGWRVPVSGQGTSPWRNLPKPSYWNYGPFWPEGGYYPAVGYRGSLGGQVYNYSLMCYYWSATSYRNPDDIHGYDGGAYDFHVTSLYDVLYSPINFRGLGMSVRCVQE